MTNPDLITLEEAHYLRETIADNMEVEGNLIQSNAKQSAYNHYNFLANLLPKMDHLIEVVKNREDGNE